MEPRRPRRRARQIKETGRPVAAPEAPRPSNVVNLMDALRKSIAAGAARREQEGGLEDERRAGPESAKKARPASRKAG